MKTTVTNWAVLGRSGSANQYPVRAVAAVMQAPRFRLTFIREDERRLRVTLSADDAAAIVRCFLPHLPGVDA